MPLQGTTKTTPKLIQEANELANDNAKKNIVKLVSQLQDQIGSSVRQTEGYQKKLTSIVEAYENEDSVALKAASGFSFDF